MVLFEIVIVLLLVGAVLALWADRIGIPYPALLALGGAAVTLFPGAPVVTLAAALALPDGGPATAFPHRDLIVFSAFCVVLTTLVVQGATLRPLLKVLGLQDDGSVEREIETARKETARAALDELEGKTPAAAADILRREYHARMQPKNTEPVSLAELQQQAALAQRRALVDLRARSVIGDDAFHAAEEEIDLLELTASARIRPSTESDALGKHEGQSS